MKRKLDWLLKSRGVEIFFEDDAIIVLNKPPGLLALPDLYSKSLPNIADILNTELGKIFIVDRIDKETSGLIVFAKTPDAHAILNGQIERKEVLKTYLGIVVGELSQKDGTIDLPLSEDSEGRTVRVDRKNGKESITEYTVLEQFAGYALLGAKPKTERMHQIRVHLREMGTPILADGLYGNGTGFFLSHVKAEYKPDGEEKPLLARTALHAASLSFTHPVASKAMSFEADLPKDMKAVLKYLRKFRPETQELKRISP
jgi:RluA family pseudouridine synthase